MKIKRPAQESDLDNTEKAFQLIWELINEHPEIEASLWAGALWSNLVYGYRHSGFTHEEFCEEITEISQFYHSWWEK